MGPPEQKLTLFIKMTKIAPSKRVCIPYFTKGRKMLEKKFWTNYGNFWPRRPWGTHFPLFMRYHCKLMTTKQKTGWNVWKIEHFSSNPSPPPGEKLNIFVTMHKIQFKINVRATPLLYKKRAKFMKQLFVQIWSILDSVALVYTTPTHFGVTPVNWG